MLSFLMLSHFKYVIIYFYTCIHVCIFAQTQNVIVKKTAKTNVSKYFSR